MERHRTWSPRGVHSEHRGLKKVRHNRELKNLQSQINFDGKSQGRKKRKGRRGRECSEIYDHENDHFFLEC